MAGSYSPFALRSALQFIMSSDVPSEHKPLLIDLLTTALREQVVHRADAASLAKADVPWGDADTAALQAFLAGKTATSWQHADELLMHAAHLLGRDPQLVRNKAADLGFGESIDYRLAKAMAAERARANG